ncbi:MAG: hypothetical protein BalsKO_10850 [Balneolaceae bacterium]
MEEGLITSLKAFMPSFGADREGRSEVDEVEAVFFDPEQLDRIIDEESKKRT